MEIKKKFTRIPKPQIHTSARFKIDDGGGTHIDRIYSKGFDSRKIIVTSDSDNQRRHFEIPSNMYEFKFIYQQLRTIYSDFFQLHFFCYVYTFGCGVAHSWWHYGLFSIPRSSRKTTSDDSVSIYQKK